MSAPATLHAGATISVSTLPGVGSRTAAAFSRLGIGSLEDLLWHIPHRYERLLAEQSISEADGAAADGDLLTVRGELAAVRAIRAGGGRPRVEATLSDGKSTLRLVWFNNPWIAKKLHPGDWGVAHGKCSRFRGYLQITNPQWTPVQPDASETALADARLRPIYPTTEDIPQDRFERLIAPVLPTVPTLLTDWLPEDERAHQSLPTMPEAMRMVHAPATPQEADLGRRRLAFDELFLLQVALAMRRWQVRHSGAAQAIGVSPQVDRAIRARLPFSLTPDQDHAVSEIVTDMGSTVPMNRLLQGDVGSGKTAVAVYALLAAVAAGHQGALVAPTEILAEQHARSLRSMLQGASMEWALLTGSTPAAERRAILAGLSDGSIPLVVGTHALFTESIEFKSLAIAIIDEQHRFGVSQRAALRAKALLGAPHTLVMTATPIPRTLAMTFFGDLDVSTIRHPPPGRQPIATRVVGFEKSDEVYRYLRTRLDAGEQAYIVVPAVEESEAGLSDVASTVERLRATHFAGLTVGFVHGRLSADDRDRAMSAFRDRRSHVLVATVVIEVGVDVPNASLMVIEHAERFGLAQLHQLRGRVGRGTAKSLCVYMGEPTTDDARRRMDVIGGTLDGFRIAEADLAIRGPGDFFGERQSGLPPFRVADLMQDGLLLEQARAAAGRRIAQSPHLDQPDERFLRLAALQRYGSALGLADVG
ncbi:MAG: ATP-dependent DNA helicase RecG [Planctomycetota bacterium]|nr:ATP-dependent DNA helicase RecG [Planctomycetota bacterium]